MRKIKLTKLFTIKILFFGIFLFLLVSCEIENDEIISQSSYKYKIEKVTFPLYQNNISLLKKIDEFNSTKKSIDKYQNKTTNSEDKYEINTKEAIYIENTEGTHHTYSFEISNKNPLELQNIVLSLQADGNYKAYLTTYQISKQERIDIYNGVSVDLSQRTSMKEIDINQLEYVNKAGGGCYDLVEVGEEWCDHPDHRLGDLIQGYCNHPKTVYGWVEEPCPGIGGGGVSFSITSSDVTLYNSGGNSSSNGGTITTSPVSLEDERCPIGSGKIFINGECLCPLGYMEDENGNCIENDCNTTQEDLKKVFPTASDNKLKEIADAINKYGKDFGIDTKEKLQHFLAQAGHESDNFKTFAEYTNYQVSLLHLTFKKHFNPYSNPTKDKNKQNPKDYEITKGSKYAKAEKLYNFVYNDKNRGKKYKLGNTETGDGYKFRGRGIFQLTGRANYKEFNTFYQKKYDKTKNLIDKPELVASDKTIAVISALWFYKNKVTITIDSKTTVESVTELVNGEDNGINDRKSKFKKAKTNIDCK